MNLLKNRLEMLRFVKVFGHFGHPKKDLVKLKVFSCVGFEIMPGLLKRIVEIVFYICYNKYNNK